MENKDFLNILENPSFDAADNPTVHIDCFEILDFASFLKEECSYEMLQCISVVDLEDAFEILYNFYSIEKNRFLIVKTTLSHQDPKIESLSSVYKSADWYERECFDLMGIKFLHHPNLSRLLMPKGWIGHPLRKDYVLSDERLRWNEKR